MKAIRPLSVRNLTNEKVVAKINELIKESNRQKEEIRQIKSKNRNIHYSRK